MRRKLLNIVEDQAPFLMFLFKDINIINDEDIVTKRRNKLNRILKERQTQKRFQTCLLVFIQPFLWIFRHKFLTWNLTTFALGLFYMIVVISYSSTSNPENMTTRCGHIVDLRQTDDKSGNIKNHIWVKYNDNKKIEEHENVADQTYYDSKKGDFICFEFLKKESDEKIQHYGVYFAIFGIMWLFGFGGFISHKLDE